jgi:hypothetical protein
VLIRKNSLQTLIEAPQNDDYIVIGPAIDAGAIVYQEVEELCDLPIGIGSHERQPRLPDWRRSERIPRLRPYSMPRGLSGLVSCQKGLWGALNWSGQFAEALGRKRFPVSALMQKVHDGGQRLRGRLSV